MDKHFVGLDLTSFTENGEMRPVSRVTLRVDDEHVVTAGDDTGLEITSDCPHATQEMVEAILTDLKGYRYRPYSAGDVNVDPAAELGDGVTASGLYSVISRIADDGSGYLGLSAPGEGELEEEYPVAGPMAQQFEQKIAQTRSLISKTAAEIRLEIQGEIEEMNSSFSVKLDGITSQVSGLDGRISTAQQTADKINWLVQSGTDSSNFTLTDRAIELVSESITLTGYVTFNDLSESGKTTINGSNITTGYLSADRIRGGTLELGGQNNTSGTLHIQDENGDIIGSWGSDGIIATKGTFSGELSAPTGTIGGFTLSSTSLYTNHNYTSSSDFASPVSNNIYIGRFGISLGTNFRVKPDGDIYLNGAAFGGTIYFQKNEGGLLPAFSLSYAEDSIVVRQPLTLGGELRSTYSATLGQTTISATLTVNSLASLSSLLVNGTSTFDSSITVSGASTFNSSITVNGRISVNGATIQSTVGIVGGNNYGFYCYNTSGSMIKICSLDTSDRCVVGNASYQLWLRGSSSRIDSALSITSDERLKTDWEDLEKYAPLLDKLTPRAYRFKEERKERYHFGFSAQEVEKALVECGLDPDGFAGLCKWKMSPEDDAYRGYDEEYGLAYTEFVALLLYQVQDLKRQVAELRATR